MFHSLTRYSALKCRSLQQEHETVSHVYQQSGSREETGSGDRLSQLNVYPSSNPLPPVRPHPLKILQASKIAPPTGH